MTAGHVRPLGPSRVAAMDASVVRVSLAFLDASQSQGMCLQKSGGIFRRFLKSPMSTLKKCGRLSPFARGNRLSSASIVAPLLDTTYEQHTTRCCGVEPCVKGMRKQSDHGKLTVTVRRRGEKNRELRF